MYLSDNPIIVPRNELCQNINLLHINFTSTTKHGHLTEDQEKAVSCLPNTKTDSLPGKLPIFLGMLVYLTKNISTELGLTTGTRGVVRDIYFKDRKEHVKWMRVQSLKIPARLGYQGR